MRLSNLVTMMGLLLLLGVSATTAMADDDEFEFEPMPVRVGSNGKDMISVRGENGASMTIKGLTPEAAKVCEKYFRLRKLVSGKKVRIVYFRSIKSDSASEITITASPLTYCIHEG